MMVALSGCLQLDRSAPDALERVVEAMDGLGWHVYSVETELVEARLEYGLASPKVTAHLQPAAEANETTLQVTGIGSDPQRQQLRDGLLELRAALDEQGSLRAPAPVTAERAATLEPRFRQRLQQVTRTDRRLARVFRILATALAVMSVVLLVEAAVTLLWQEPLSYVYAQRQQNQLDDQLRTLEARYRRQEQERLLSHSAKARPGLPAQAARFGARTRSGEPLGRLRVPAIDLDTVFVQDASPASLQKGPAHYRQTALPGEHGTVGIAGHRTTYQAPFHDLDQLDKGDRVVIRVPYGLFRYRVESRTVVEPEDVAVLTAVDHDRLVLTACHPLYSASQRIVIFARLRSARPLGP